MKSFCSFFVFHWRWCALIELEFIDASRSTSAWNRTSVCKRERKQVDIFLFFSWKRQACANRYRWLLQTHERETIRSHVWARCDKVEQPVRNYEMSGESKTSTKLISATTSSFEIDRKKIINGKKTRQNEQRKDSGQALSSEYNRRQQRQRWWWWRYRPKPAKKIHSIFIIE